jgi:predicted nucleotidyltransferase
MILKNTALKNKLKKIIKQFPDIKDVLIFGSVIRGKEDPSDIDILLIFKEKVNKEIEYVIRKELEKYAPSISIISKTEETMLDPSFDARESMLFEGLSMINNHIIAENYGFSSVGVFKYNTHSMNNAEKTKFYYALNGRNNQKGIAEQMECIKMSDNILIVPLKNIDKIKEFFEVWHMVYVYIPTLIPLRLYKKALLE